MDFSTALDRSLQSSLRTVAHAAPLRKSLCYSLCYRLRKEVQQQRILVVDPVTTAWLKSSVDGVFGYPALVRFSWQTTTRMLEDTSCAVHWYVHCSIVRHGKFLVRMVSAVFTLNVSKIDASIDGDAMPQVRTALRERPHNNWSISHCICLAVTIWKMPQLLYGKHSRLCACMQHLGSCIRHISVCVAGNMKQMILGS